MQKIAKFEKVSFDRFQKDWLKAFPETEDVQSMTVSCCHSAPPPGLPGMIFMCRLR